MTEIRGFLLLKIAVSFCSSPFWRAPSKLWHRKLKPPTSIGHNLLKHKLSVAPLELPFEVTFLLDMLLLRYLAGISRPSAAILLDFRAPPSDKGIVWRHPQPYSQLKGTVCR